MKEDDREKVLKRSERIIKGFNDFKGKKLGELKISFLPAFTAWLNGSIIAVKRGEVELEFETRPEMANPTGLLHGGMQSAILDDTIGITSATLGYEGFLISIDTHVDYLGKVKVGEKIRSVGRVVREGRSIAHITAEIYDSKGDLVSTADSNLLRTSFTPEYVKRADKEI